jgi:hypothetical protein
MRTPDAAMRTSPSHVYYPWQVFQRWRFQSQEGHLHECSTPPRCLEHQVFQDLQLQCSKHDGATATIFRGGATNRKLSRED